MDNFQPGADFNKAKLFAATRTFAVAPWSEDVEAKPILAVSDNSGNTAKLLAKAGFLQFGCSERANVSIVPQVRTEEAIREVVREAASLAPPGALAIEKSGAIIVYTLASQELGSVLERESNTQGVQCINVLEPVLAAMEAHFGLQRSLYAGDEEQQLRGFEAEGMTVFAASDSSGGSTHGLVCAALQQFPGSGVETITLCPETRSLEEINCIVQQVQLMDSIVVFSFASPGMSRFMRQQCERAGVLYADVYQPVLIAFEKYLDYPPVGVPGGHDLPPGSDAFLKWKTLRVPQ